MIFMLTYFAYYCILLLLNIAYNDINAICMQSIAKETVGPL